MWFLPRRDIAFARRFLPTALKERLSPGARRWAAGSCQSCTAAGLSDGSPHPGLSLHRPRGSGAVAAHPTVTPRAASCGTPAPTLTRR